MSLSGPWVRIWILLLLYAIALGCGLGLIFTEDPSVSLPRRTRPPIEP